jgi:hypothetical protein
MKGVFVNWTKPYVERKRLRGHAFKVYREMNSDVYTTTDEEILYTILSVGYWRKFNGPTKLYTDKEGLRYYVKNNMVDLWDEIDINTLEGYNEVDAAQFWTSGKSYCIGKEEGPFCFMDLDLMVKQKLPDWVFDADITIPYWEIPRGYYYPTKEQYSEVKHWSPPADYSYKMLVPNTSFLYINNKKVQSEYLKDHQEAVNTHDEIPEWFWLVTDQGLFGQTLRRNNVKVQTLTDKVFLADNEGFDEGKVGDANGYFYQINHDVTKDELNWWHIWIRKVWYNQNEEGRVNDCKMFYREITENLPKYKHLLNNPRLEKYKN